MTGSRLQDRADDYHERQALPRARLITPHRETGILPQRVDIQACGAPHTPEEQPSAPGLCSESELCSADAKKFLVALFGETLAVTQEQFRAEETSSSSRGSRYHTSVFDAA